MIPLQQGLHQLFHQIFISKILVYDWFHYNKDYNNLAFSAWRALMLFMIDSITTRITTAKMFSFIRQKISLWLIPLQQGLQQDLLELLGVVFLFMIDSITTRITTLAEQCQSHECSVYDWFHYNKDYNSLSLSPEKICLMFMIDSITTRITTLNTWRRSWDYISFMIDSITTRITTTYLFSVGKSFRVYDCFHYNKDYK